ncbi:hypothetical protein K504DRAFT_102498 [Pleomassaria siparia CBS 279.74]|uniref:Uncharacterized protein n=1 Tax=Pleomassaria siparia CBS 279.74 TaxID=1314801 RepID=A0A6G1JX39_9PLEO|nr:hypothetical protein K504DRAFT_102498 [Pleomassaria siparia CBS 279.74]
MDEKARPQSSVGAPQSSVQAPQTIWPSCTLRQQEKEAIEKVEEPSLFASFEAWKAKAEAERMGNVGQPPVTIDHRLKRMLENPTAAQSSVPVTPHQPVPAIRPMARRSCYEPPLSLAAHGYRPAPSYQTRDTKKAFEEPQLFNLPQGSSVPVPGPSVSVQANFAPKPIMYQDPLVNGNLCSELDGKYITPAMPPSPWAGSEKRDEADSFTGRDACQWLTGIQVQGRRAI